MKSLLLLLIFLPYLSFAQQANCEKAQDFILPDNDLQLLTERVCKEPHTQDPDIHLRRDEAKNRLSIQDFLVFEYTSDCYKTINASFRNSNAKDAQLLGHQLDLVLCKKDIFQGETFRGTDLPDDVIEKYKIDEVIILPGFTSTSYSSSIACEFTKNTFFRIYSKTGRLIEKLSNTEDEKEVLFRLGTQFKVINVIKINFKAAAMSGCNSAKNYIELQEI